MRAIAKLFPVLEWLPAYSREWLRADTIAGLTAAAVVIPQAMAYAAIAGLPIMAGLYTSAVALIAYAVTGTSPALSVSTTSTLAILTAAAAGAAGHAGDALTASATLAALAGVFLLLAALLRLGVIANFISAPVLTGFKAGVGLVIVLDQLPKLLGVHYPKAHFLGNLAALARHVPESSVATVILSLAMLAMLLGLKRFAPRVPGPLVTVAAGIAASLALGLDGYGIARVGDVRAGLPAFALPDPSLAGALWPAALGVALMTFIETVAAGRTFTRAGAPRPRTDQELVALGAANVAVGFFQGMPAGGGTSQTAVNFDAGARSQVAGLVTAAVAIATLLFLAPLVRAMPSATLAAVVVVAGAGLVHPADFRAIRRVRLMEFLWAVVAMAGVMLLGTLRGILVAVIMSMLAVLYQANRPAVWVLGRKPGTNVFRPRSKEHPEDEAFDGLLLVRVEGAVYFANASRIGDQLWSLIREHPARFVVLDCSGMSDIEYTALQMLAESEEKLRNDGTMLCLAALNPGPLQMIQQQPLGRTLGRERMFFNVQQAVEKLQRDESRGGGES